MRSYTFDKMCHDLAKDPYHLTPVDLLDLCPYQIEHILLRPKDDDATEQDFLDKRRRKKDPEYADIPDDGSYRTLFYKSKLAFGLSRKEVDQMWEEYLKQNPNP